MSTSMNNGDTPPPPYPIGSKVTRIPVYLGGFPGEQIVAKVKQPSIKPTPLTNNLHLQPPAIVLGDEFRNRTLESMFTVTTSCKCQFCLLLLLPQLFLFYFIPLTPFLFLTPKNSFLFKQPIANSIHPERMTDIQTEQDNARSTWSLIDQTTATQYSGTAEHSDPNNRYYLLYTNLTGPPNQNSAHLLTIKQLNLQKVNTAVRFRSLEEAEGYQKDRTKAIHHMDKTMDLGAGDGDLESVRQTILGDKLKSSKKGGKAGTGSTAKDNKKKPKSSRDGGSGGFGEEGEFDYDDGEGVWEACDDDEGIANRELNDFEDTGDWAGGKKSDYIDQEGDEFNDENKDFLEIQAKYSAKKTGGSGGGGGGGDDSDDDDDIDQVYGDDDDLDGISPSVGGGSGSGQNWTMDSSFNTGGGVKRRNAPLPGDDDDEEIITNEVKRQKNSNGGGLKKR